MLDYMRHAKYWLQLYGKHVFPTLASTAHFHMWLREHKEAHQGSFIQ